MEGGRRRKNSRGEGGKEEGRRERKGEGRRVTCRERGAPHVEDPRSLLTLLKMQLNNYRTKMREVAPDLDIATPSEQASEAQQTRAGTNK